MPSIAYKIQELSNEAGDVVYESRSFWKPKGWNFLFPTTAWTGIKTDGLKLIIFNMNKLIYLLLLLSIGCKPENPNCNGNFDQRLKLINNSSVLIQHNFVSGFPDTSFSNLIENNRLGFEETPPRKDDNILQYCDWNVEFSDAPQGIIMFFFFADSTGNSVGSTRNENEIIKLPFLGRKDYTLQDFEDMNWVIEINDSTFMK